MKIPTFLLLVSLLPAGSQPAATAAYRAGISQRALQTSTLRVKEELAALIRDYERYAIAAPEIARLQQAVNSLDPVSGQEMPEAAELLLAASRAPQENAGASLARASAGQTRIGTHLREVADRLALHADQAAMQKRLEELALRQAANLRATRRVAGLFAEWQTSPGQLAAGGEDAERVLRVDEKRRQAWDDFNRRAHEQEALAKEIALAVTALANVAADPLAPSAPHFNQALETARSTGVADQARQAADDFHRDPAASAAAQESAAAALRSLVARLDGAKSDPERLHEMASQLTDLAAQQTSIAQRTPRMWGEQKARATEDQQVIGDQLQVLRQRLLPLHPETAAQAGETARQASETGGQMERADFSENAAVASHTAGRQRQLADHLAAMGETLRRQAEALASGNSPGGPPDESALSPQAAAIQQAMRQLVDARIQIELASRLNAEQGDFQSHIRDGQNHLSAATAKANEGGDTVGRQVHQSLADARRFAATAATGDRVEHHLYHSRAEINQALTALQQAAMELAAREQQQGGGAEGSNIHHAASRTGGAIHPATAAASEARRDALSLLQQEKTAPEFKTRVDQYIKNLSDAPEP